jgi:hypothetical protein
MFTIMTEEEYFQSAGIISQTFAWLTAGTKKTDE